MDSSDQTIIKPRPGKSAILPKPSGNKPAGADQTIITPRKRANPSQSEPKPAEDSTLIIPRKKSAGRQPIALTIDSGLSRPGESELISAAYTLLSLPPQLRQVTGNLEINQLHTEIKRLIQEFEVEALRVCNDPQIRRDASYILCALIDETVQNTAWGENSSWAQNPMLSIFHQETYGGERVYEILSQALQTPSRYDDVLELIFLTLSLGYMGKYRVDPKGPIKIEQSRSQIYDVLTRSRDELKTQLSPNCNPLTGFASKLYSFLPYWILAAVLVLVAFSIYSYWLFQLNSHSDQTRQLLASIVPLSSELVAEPEQVPQSVRSLELLLADEIERGLLEINHFPKHTAITLKDDQMFASASANINEGYLPILDKVAKSLETLPGQVIVTGHTDNQAIRTAKYPSNWHLSLARASSVVKYLDDVGSLDSRLLPEGRGAQEPVADNTTEAGRAKNRRVVVDIYYLRNVDKRS